MRRRSTNQVLSGLFSTSSDKEIRSKSCFASLMESEEKIAATLAGTQVAAAYPVAGACAATKNKETADPHLPSATACSPPVCRPLPQPGSTCLEHSPAVVLSAQACRTRPGHGTNLRHQPGAPTCGTELPCGSSPHQAADSDLSSSFNFSSFKFLNFKLLCFQVNKLSSQARSHIPDWQSGMLLLLHPFAKEKTSF